MFGQSNTPLVMKLFVAILAAVSTIYTVAQDTKTAQETYFPTHKDGGKGDGISEFEAEWYGGCLKRMAEPSLLPAPKGTVSIRFLILPTWGNPISVRATLEGERYRLIGRRLDGHGGYDPGKLTEKTDVLLSVEQSKRLTDLVAAAKIFELPSADNVSGTDGDQWIMETVRDQKHRVAVRWTAGYDTAKRGLTEFVRFCDFLISESTLTQRATNRGHDIIPKSK